MIVDHRTDTSKPTRVAEYLKVFGQFGGPVQIHHPGQAICYFATTVDTVNQADHFWGYEPLADIELQRIPRDAITGWEPYKATAQDLIMFQHNKILTHSSFSTTK